MTDNEKSVIIGLWRMGNPWLVIAVIIGCSRTDIYSTISEYKKKLRKNEQ